MKKTLLASIALSSMTVFAADITLPTPSTDGGMSLMRALSLRRTGREFSDKALNLLLTAVLLIRINLIILPIILLMSILQLIYLLLSWFPIQLLTSVKTFHGLLL